MNVVRDYKIHVEASKNTSKSTHCHAHKTGHWIVWAEVMYVLGT